MVFSDPCREQFGFFLLIHQQQAEQAGKKNAVAVLSETAKQRESETTACVWIIPQQGSGNATSLHLKRLLKFIIMTIYTSVAPAASVFPNPSLTVIHQASFSLQNSHQLTDTNREALGVISDHMPPRYLQPAQETSQGCRL